MTVDTEIRHVSMPGANLFLELGFTPDEARLLNAASRRHISDTRLLKGPLDGRAALDARRYSAEERSPSSAV